MWTQLPSKFGIQIKKNFLSMVIKLKILISSFQKSSSSHNKCVNFLFSIVHVERSPCAAINLVMVEPRMNAVPSSPYHNIPAFIQHDCDCVRVHARQIKAQYAPSLSGLFWPQYFSANA